MSFDFSLTPVRDSEGKVAFIVPEAREINDLKRAQEALIRSEKLAAVGRLASSIAHEINNPLEAVMNVLYIARTDESCSEAMRNCSYCFCTIAARAVVPHMPRFLCTICTNVFLY